MRILLIEDSARLRELVCETLRNAGWRVDAFATGLAGREALGVTEYDLVLLDLGLPDEDGLSLLKAMRRAGGVLPVLILTARGAIDERITGLDAGADDFLTKPFNNGELLARIRALLRRAPITAMPELAFGNVTLVLATGVARSGDRELKLAPRERSLLEMLMRHGGQVVRKRRIEQSFSEFGDERTANAVELTVSRLRKKLGTAPTGLAIETIRGIGYMLREVSS